MTAALMTTKSNGVQRQLYTCDAPGKRTQRGKAGIIRCEAADCKELVHFTSTDGFCLQCWTRAKTEPVRRKATRRR